MQDRQDDFRRGSPFFGMLVDRDAAAVIGDADRLVGMDRDRNIRAMTGQGFVDRVIDDLENHVMETGAVVGVADVHSGAFPDGFEAL